MKRTSRQETVEPLDRERVLREIDSLIDEAHARGEPAVVRIAGPSGIGKTTVLRHAVGRRFGLQGALWATARPGDRTEPAACIRRIMGALVPSTASDGEVVDALRAAVETHKVLCLDDVQWCDEVSRGIIRDLASKPGTALTLLFADRRDDAPELFAHRSVRVAPMRRSAAAKLVHRWYGSAPAAVTNEIISASAGIPFSIVFLAEHAAAVRARSSSDTEPSVSAAIARRLERSGNAGREAVRHAACLGSSADVRYIARAMRIGVAELSNALTELVDLATVEDLYLTFRHAVIADAIRSSIPEPVVYYERLLTALDDDDDRPDVLAVRFRCARGCGKDAIAAESALRLGRALAASASLETALEYLVLAVRYGPRPLPATYALEYAGVLQQLARDGEAASFLRSQLQAAIYRNDVVAAADLLASFFSAALALERIPQLEALCSRVEAMAQPDSPIARRLRSVRLAASAFSGRLDEFEDIARAGLDWVDQRPASLVAALRADDQRAREALETYQAGLRSEHARQEPSDRVLGASIALFDAGVDALPMFDAHVGARAAIRAHPSESVLCILRSIAQGHWKEAREALSNVPLWDAAYHEPYALLDVRLLAAALMDDEPADPRRTVEEIRLLVRDRRRRHAASPARWYLITAHSLDAAPPDIARFVSETLDVPPMPYLITALPLAIALLAPFFGETRCAESLAKWPQFRSRWHRAHFALALGLLRHDEGELATARRLFDELHAPVFAMIAGLALGDRRPRDVGLAEQLKEAHVTRQLTRRELEVARLAAKGLINREIGSELGITERTVEEHLTKVYQKLEIRGRTELPPRLTWLGY